MKTLKQILEVYAPDTKDGKAFVQKHAIVKTTDANGNGDDVFQAAKVKKIERKKERHGHEPVGYGPDEDAKVYEEVSMFAKMENSAEDFKSFIREHTEQMTDEELDLIEQIYNDLDEEEAQTFVSVVEAGELDSFLEELNKALEE